MAAKWLPATCLVSVISAIAVGQNVASPTFEVASVKPVSRDQRSIVDFVISPGGRLRITNLTLADMIRQAYQVKYWQVKGGPGWLDTDRFNVEAKAAGEATRKELMLMLQSLLTERFHLRVRREAREGKVYELVIASHGRNLEPSTANTSFLRLYRKDPPELPGIGYTIVGQKVSLSRLAEYLMGELERPVLDHTGTSGDFDFKIDYAIEGHSETGPSIFTALKEQLGLRLRPAKGSIEMLVIEHADRPTEN
jgi:uncharacterized protein (TIGR03435 family)